VQRVEAGEPGAHDHRVQDVTTDSVHVAQARPEARWCGGVVPVTGRRIP